jgi:hypothetical protein
MKYLVIILLFALFSCKKQTTKPVEVAYFECYCKSGNATINADKMQTILTKNYSTSFEVTNEQSILSIKNNIKSSNDSLNLKVTYKGITKQIGVKCVNTLNTLSFQLSTF